VGLGTTEIIVIALVIMVLFGAKRLPEASRSLGRSLRIFKAETKGLRDDSDTTVTAEPLPPAQSSGADPARPAPAHDQAHRPQP
jgi:sec-independent protein translocase protein TatA